MQTFDEIDRRILRAMQAGQTVAGSEIARAVGLSPATCWRRVERLESSGVIRGHTIDIDARAFGYEIEVSLRVTLDKTQPDAFDTFIVAARRIPEVNEIQTFLGRVDVRLNVMARDLSHYQEIYRRDILILPNIADIESLMVIATVKDDRSLPL
ncbi:MAG: Lrp/AsnC family transcriptional regulator [Paracoccaceae bacterium]|nr:Lrp/AsnC family transcriptional regulator [Paracoccaceae bacterium]MDE2911448.1 Lrp/AsnC family transcriptional regulator [Paracoccaceae bacterium]